MKRIITLTGIITLIALFNMGGCGGSDDISNGFKPVIDKIVLYKNDQLNQQVSAYTQGDDGVIQLTISDYDLNAETIELQVDQCTTSACDNRTPYHTEGPYVLSKQSDVEFTYDFANFIKTLPATYYYYFEFEVTDKEGQIGKESRIIEFNTGLAPSVEKMIFYNKNQPAILLDTWQITKHYSYLVTEITASDLDLNTSQFYVERTCLSTESGVIPTFPKIGPVKLSQQTDQNFLLKIEAIKDADIVSLIDGFTSEPGTCVISVELEDALGNTAQISRSITLTR
ncbi:conserved hypothetical protein, secreted [Candidatus Magnetomorum sp. HK-1]|nr:conserved hypothetical protein, secreted [Candidatus Magnetomorum sp. HK-1]